MSEPNGVIVFIHGASDIGEIVYTNTIPVHIEGELRGFDAATLIRSTIRDQVKKSGPWFETTLLKCVVVKGAEHQPYLLGEF